MSEELNFEEFAPWLVVVTTLVGVVLRVLLLATKGMWLDETFSVWIASQSVGDMLQWIVRIDQHPPLYYLLLHYWIALFGDAPYYVRMLSVLFGTATIPVMYLIGKRISGVMVGLVASVLMAFSLFNVFYAQETRMYTLLTFNAAIAIYALVRLLTDSCAARPIGSQIREYLHGGRIAAPVKTEPQEGFSYQDKARSPSGWRGWISRERWQSFHAIETDLAWIVFILFSAATLLSHNTAVLFPLATNIFVLGLMLFQRVRKPESPSGFQAPSFGNWVKAQVAIFLLWSPWIVPFIQQARKVDQRFWVPQPTLESVIEVVKTFLNPSASVPASQATMIWTLYALVLCLGMLHFRKKFSRFIFLAALFAIPFLGELLVSIRRPIFFDRTLIWTTIPLYLVLAAGVAQLRFRPLLVVVLGSLAAMNLFAVSDYYRFYQKEDWRTPAAYLGYFAENDDLVLFNSNFVEVPFNYYFRTYEEFYSLKVEKQGIPFDLFNDGILEPEMTEKDIPQLTALLQSHDRVWLVYSHDLYTDPNGLIPKTIASQKKLIRSREFYGGKVQLYGNP